jgi:hypothetical protein
MKKSRGGLKPASLLSLTRGVVGMEIKERLKEWFHSIENDPQRKLHLLAFRDFCVDLFEEEYGKMPPEEEIATPFVEGLLIQT